VSAKHTPGPWKFVPDFKCANGDQVCGVKSEKTHGAVAWPSGNDGVEEIANAHLISAAPQLLEVCEFVLKHAFERKWPGDEAAFNMLHAAIKKANGGAP